MVSGKTGDPYEGLVKARETAVRLVMINGVARYGTPAIMATLGAPGESVRVGGNKRTLYLAQESADPVVASVSLRDARAALKAALNDIPDLAAEMEQPRAVIARRAALDAPEPVVWSLALDEIQASPVNLRPRLPFGSPTDFTGPERVAAAATSVPLSKLLVPIALDPLTVADDADYLTAIENQPNVPEAIRAGLRALYK